MDELDRLREKLLGFRGQSQVGIDHANELGAKAFSAREQIVIKTVQFGQIGRKIARVIDFQIGT
mgnify:CR=1 FL=1